jgi:tRNA threonylcarbamoyladenosine biosynthesis protein TsaB
MRVLAIDTALANCAAAVLDDGSASACFETCGEEIGRGHAEKLMDMIGTVMAESSTAFSDLDRVAVTVGPGSFTGLRVGLAVARGFGLVLEKPVVGVTTLAAIARSCAPATMVPRSSSLSPEKVTRSIVSSFLTMANHWTLLVFIPCQILQ